MKKLRMILLLSSLFIGGREARADDKSSWSTLLFTSFSNIIESAGHYHHLSQINFNYSTGPLDKKIGEASIGIIEEDNTGFNLKISGLIKIIGQKLELNYQLNQSELENEVAIKFYVGGNSSVLEIIPEPGFDQTGGNLKIWYKGDNAEWNSYNLRIQKVAKNFILLARRNDYYQKIKKLEITVSGYSLNEMEVKKIELK